MNRTKKRFNVSLPVVEVRRYFFDIEAENKAEAEKIAKESYEAGDFDVYNEFVSSDIAEDCPILVEEY